MFVCNFLPLDSIIRRVPLKNNVIIIIIKFMYMHRDYFSFNTAVQSSHVKEGIVCIRFLKDNYVKFIVSGQTCFFKGVCKQLKL